MTRGIIEQLIMFAIIIACWELVVRLGMFNSLLLPSPINVGWSLISLFIEKNFLSIS